MYIRILFIFLFIPLVISAQYIPEYTENNGIYDFLDEIASEKIISVNKSIPVLSKTQVADLLLQADSKSELLNNRQLKELKFYISAYSLEIEQLNSSISGNTKTRISKNPLAITYSDSLFKLSVRPLGAGLLYINDSATVQNRWWGAALNGYVGKHFAFYSYLTDHWETEILASQKYLTQLTGGQYKSAVNRTGGEYSTCRGGVTWSWNWGHIGLIYDRINWGSGYNGSIIFGGRTTPFPQVVLSLKPAKWFRFNYIHGWLSSLLIDTTRSFQSGNGYVKVYQEKYVAANMFTFIPWQSLHISVGNSIIYAGSGVYPGFLIPTLFFRSVDENATFINNNSQFFADFSFRPFKHLHLYSSVFFDEFQYKRVFDSKTYNPYSIKAGLRLSGWPLKNVVLTTEYTQTNPVTYKHQMDVLYYSTNNYSLGNYLRDNSEEFFFKVSYKPIQKTSLSVSYLDAIHCNEYIIPAKATLAIENPVLKDKIWHNKSLTGSLSYELFAGTTLQGSIMYSNITSVAADGHSAAYYLDMFTPKFLQGKHLTMIGGFSIAF